MEAKADGKHIYTQDDNKDDDDSEERMNDIQTHSNESKSGCERINLVTFFIFIFITFIMRFFLSTIITTM